MKVINSYIKYLYILLGIIIFVLLIKLLTTLSKMNKSINIISNDTNHLNDRVNHLNTTLDNIKKTEQSWLFFTSIYAIFAILRETFKYRKAEHSLSKSFVKSVTRHTKQLSRIKL